CATTPPSIRPRRWWRASSRCATAARRRSTSARKSGRGSCADRLIAAAGIASAAAPLQAGPSMSEYVDSYYARTLAEPGAYPALAGSLEVETVVIGGGLAGCADPLDLAGRR